MRKKVGIVTDGDGFFYLGGGIEKGENRIRSIKKRINRRIRIFNKKILKNLKQLENIYMLKIKDI